MINLGTMVWRIIADVETSILPPDLCIMGLLFLILKILVYGIGAAATVGIVVAGIQYMTARDNESQVTAAKTRLFNVAIGLVAWAVMWTVMNWLIPGGMTLDFSKTTQQVCADQSVSVVEGGAASLCSL